MEALGVDSAHQKLRRVERGVRRFAKLNKLCLPLRIRAATEPNLSGAKDWSAKGFQMSLAPVSTNSSFSFFLGIATSLFVDLP